MRRGNNSVGEDCAANCCNYADRQTHDGMHIYPHKHATHSSQAAQKSSIDKFAGSPLRKVRREAKPRASCKTHCRLSRAASALLHDDRGTLVPPAPPTAPVERTSGMMATVVEEWQLRCAAGTYAVRRAMESSSCGQLPRYSGFCCERGRSPHLRLLSCGSVSSRRQHGGRRHRRGRRVCRQGQVQ